MLCKSGVLVSGVLIRFTDTEPALQVTKNEVMIGWSRCSSSRQVAYFLGVFFTLPTYNT